MTLHIFLLLTALAPPRSHINIHWLFMH